MKNLSVNFMGPGRPALSVIIPVYNVEEYLSECLESVVSQTLRDIEIICINDGSSDRSLEILQAFAKKDARIKVVNQQNKGVAAARNAGLKLVTSDYIAFLDSDDYLEKNAYELALQKIKNSDLVIFGTQVFGISNKKMEGYLRLSYKGRYNFHNPNVYTRINVCTWNKIFKTQIIRENNIEFPEGLCFEDDAFVYKYISFVSTVYFLDEKLYYYRQRKNSIMHSLLKDSAKAFDHLYILKDIYSFLQRNQKACISNDLYNMIFKYCFSFAYEHTSFFEKETLIKLAYEYVEEMFAQKKSGWGSSVEKMPKERFWPANALIKSLAKKKFDPFTLLNYTFIEQVFSIKKIVVDTFFVYRVISVFGLKIHFFSVKKSLIKFASFLKLWQA